jgi:hypothetical protein
MTTAVPAVPGAWSPSVMTMTAAQRLERVLRICLEKQYLGAEFSGFLQSLLTPTTLAILCGTLVVWLASHAFGVGEIIDVLLLTVGAFSIGWSITDVARDLYAFADGTINGKSERDLDVAAQAFGRAVVKGGITVVMAVLLRRSVKQIQIARGPNVGQAMTPRDPGLPRVGPDPAGNKLWSNPGTNLSDPTVASFGETTAFGAIRIRAGLPAIEQKLTLVHELVHRFLTPRLGVLRTFRVRFGMAGYMRSLLLQYLEEALAETVAQLRVHGLSGIVTGIKFPVANGYMTLSELASEAGQLGTIVAGTTYFSVSFTPSEADPSMNMCQAPGK